MFYYFLLNFGIKWSLSRINFLVLFMAHTFYIYTWIRYIDHWRTCDYRKSYSMLFKLEVWINKLLYFPIISVPFELYIQLNMTKDLNYVYNCTWQKGIGFSLNLFFTDFFQTIQVWISKLFFFKYCFNCINSQFVFNGIYKFQILY